jgi:hypothetical protein
LLGKRYGGRFSEFRQSKIFIFLTVATAGEGQIDRSSKKLIKKAQFKITKNNIFSKYTS